MTIFKKIITIYRKQIHSIQILLIISFEILSQFYFRLSKLERLSIVTYFISCIALATEVSVILFRFAMSILYDDEFVFIFIQTRWRWRRAKLWISFITQVRSLSGFF